MCGICGIVSLSPVDARLLERMNETLRRRGPDDSGSVVDGGLGLAMRRLSIIDIAGSPQPIYSTDRRYVGVFNGEIYNYRELRAQLQERGYAFRTQGDGEVVLNMFAEYGVEAFRRLRGMFGVAIWDSAEHELWLARDPLGIKPLFYSLNDGELLFGSEMKAILETGRCDERLDPQGLDAYLAYTYIPAPYTIYRGIRRLEPGTCLRWKSGEIQQRRYWFLPDEIGEVPLSTGELGEVIADSVRSHLVADVPVGAFLSGGIDSSAIVSRMKHDGDHPVEAFTIRFDEADSHLFDETPYARELRERYGFELREELVNLGFLGPLEEGIAAFDEPFADDSIIPSFEVARFAASSLKVCMSGAGGDEFFGGYNRYQGLALQSRLDAIIPQPLKPLAASILNGTAGLIGRHKRRGDLVHRFARELGNTPDEAYLSYVTSLSAIERSRLLDDSLHRDVDQALTRDLIARHQRDFEGPDRVQAAMYADTQTYLPEDVLALSDRLGMWHSLEIRVPLADVEVATAAFSLTGASHVTTREKKIALKAAVQDWLPSSILSHPKQGFESPTAAWLRGKGRTQFKALLESTRELWSDFLNPVSVDTLLDEHNSGRADRAKTLFAILSFVTWLQQRHG